MSFVIAFIAWNILDYYFYINDGFIKILLAVVIDIVISMILKILIAAHDNYQYENRRRDEIKKTNDYYDDLDRKRKRAYESEWRNKFKIWKDK